MSLRTVPIGNTKKEVKAFAHFMKDVYQTYPHFVPPIYTEVVKFIRNGPFNKLGEKQLFLAYRDDKIVARLSVHRNFAHNDHYKTNQGFFGFFEALDDQEAVNQIFAEGERWLKERGCDSVLGPMNFAVYDEMGLLVDAFDQDPIVLCTYNPPYYLKLLENCGFQKEVDWFAFLKDTTVPNFMRLISQRVLKQQGVVIREVRKKDIDKEAESVKHIFNQAWAENWGNVPFSDDQWHHLVKDLKMILKEKLAFITEINGVPIAFAISLPDANQAVKKAKGSLFPFGFIKILLELRKVTTVRTTIMGVLKEHRNKGYEIAMVHKTIENGVSLGYNKADCSLIVETNTAMVTVLEKIGCVRYKTFRVLRKSI
jgi:RimJ/RimL family protein N-acetyltransferase